MQKHAFYIEIFKYTDDLQEDDIENETSGEPEIKNADPYYNKPYDTILRAQAILDKLINDFINFVSSFRTIDPKIVSGKF